MRELLFFLIMCLLQNAVASTFVGNGGNAGDIELQITLGQIQKGFEFINRDKDAGPEKLCICSQGFSGRPICDVLKQLTEDQVLYCSKVIRMKAEDLARVVGKKDQLKLQWTNKEIEVEELGALRGADAVTNQQEQSITIKQDRFLQMNESEKVFLLAHELFHLTSLQGALLKDEGAIGPFKSKDGGRQLLNAMAATLVVLSDEYGVFRSNESTLKRSKSYVQNWLTLGLVGVSTPNDPTTALDIERASGFQLGYRYQVNSDFGVVLDFQNLNGEKKILSTAMAKENRRIFSLGGAYRWFPFSNPLSFSGQSHFVMAATLDLHSGSYEVSDPSIGTSASSSSTGYTFACKYFIPFQSGFWGHAGIAYSGLNYRYNLDNQMNLDYKNNGTSLALGVSYGF